MRTDTVPHCWSSIDKAMLIVCDRLEKLVEARRDHDAEVMHLAATALMKSLGEINDATLTVLRLSRKGQSDSRPPRPWGGV